MAILFIIARKWKQHTYPSTDKWINKGGIFVHGILFGHKKEWGTDTCYDVNETRKQYAKEKKQPVTKRSYIIWFHSYDISRTGKSIEMENRLLIA